MASTQEANPQLYNSVPHRENPSYGTELPQDFPYDPGTTSTLFELGYVPSRSSVIPFLVVGLLIGVIAVIQLKRHRNITALFSLGACLSLFLVYLGPMTVPALFRVTTTMGLAKIVALMLTVVSAYPILRHRPLPISKSVAVVPIGAYLVSILISIFYVTNLNFFTEDLSLILGGLLFYYVGFTYVSTDRTRSFLVRMFTFASLIPAFIVAVAFFFPQEGAGLVNVLYPKYENIVFQFDRSRGRILSVIDLEFFVPFILCTLTEGGWRYLGSVVVFAIVSVAVFLTDYRYRFLTYFAGTGIYVMLIGKRYLKTVAVVGVLFAVLFTGYVGVSSMLGQKTIINRFLLEDYANDVDSINRRFVMMGQAIDLFSQHPITGVGLGNYKDNVSVVYESFGGRFYEPYYKILENVYAYPHNWFLLVLAENGIVGFLILAYLLYAFGKTDLMLARHLTGDSRRVFLAFSIASWLYVFANQFTPLNNSQPMVIFFWAFRGIIDRLRVETAGEPGPVVAGKRAHD